MINVTPLVDVVLVLLIVFLVVTPLLDERFDVGLPTERSGQLPPEGPQVVLRLEADGSVLLSGRPVASENLPSELRAAIEATSDRTVFFQAHPDALYRDAVHVMDLARDAGAETIGTLVSSPAHGEGNAN